MKSLAFIILSFFLLSFVGNKPKGDLGKDNIKGKVKLIKWLQYRVNNKSGEIEKDSLDDESDYKYDSSGNRTETEFHYRNHVAKFKDSIIYDGNGDISCIYEFQSNKFYVKTFFKYDSIGDMVEQKTYNDTNFLCVRNTYSYDKKGNQILWNEYAMYANNEKGGVDYFLPSGDLMHIYTYRYDSVNDRISVKENYPDGGFCMMFTYKYDNKGNMVEYYDLHENGNVRDKRTYQYSNFDKIGNWQRQVYFDNDKPIVIIERTIEYYPQ